MSEPGFRPVPLLRGMAPGAPGRDGARSVDAVRAAHAVLLAGLQVDHAAFLRERYVRLAAILEMLEDDGWLVQPRDRQRIVTVLECFVMVATDEPADHITLIELVSRELSHDLEAYQEFRQLRRRAARRHSPHAIDRAQWLADSRDALQLRMRQRREHDQYTITGTVRRWWSLLNF